MKTYFEYLATALGLVLALLLFVRGRRHAARVSRERDLVVKSVDQVVAASRVWNYVVALFVVSVVTYLAFREELVANILLATLVLIAVIAFFARRKGRIDSHLGGGA
ncbi:MAG: hypothetical protein F9K18_00890 [Thermoanaerobaculia bacterium]|nr:MAG: hypothetical protein F9K18_00890 [Thermoanaerobaculia bacterium]